MTVNIFSGDILIDVIVFDDVVDGLHYADTMQDSGYKVRII